jgi:hypothetical protein
MKVNRKVFAEEKITLDFQLKTEEKEVLREAYNLLTYIKAAIRCDFNYFIAKSHYHNMLDMIRDIYLAEDRFIEEANRFVNDDYDGEPILLSEEEIDTGES